MMKKCEKTIIGILSCFLTIGFSCSKTKEELVIKKIYTRNFKPINFNSSKYTGVRILNTYPNEKVCDGVKTINANLYVCKNEDGGDTLYVFNRCDAVPDFAKKASDESFVIENEKIEKNIPEVVFILVPKSFEIPVNAKSVFASLNRWKD